VHALEEAGRARLLTRARDPQQRARNQVFLLERVATEFCRVHGLALDVRGRLPTTPAVLVANHVSYLDPLVLVRLVPAAPIAKKNVEGWPIIGAVGHALGVLFVDRNDPHSGARVLHRAHRLLQGGISVLNFPEGTTTTGDQLLPFRRGIFGIARLAGRPVVPIALRYHHPMRPWIGEELFLPHYLRTAAQERAKVEVHIGAAIDARDHPDAAAVAAVTRATIGHLLTQTEERT
jgi:1-acyl-sn-glycerol-3-phosphate acyltransferase